MHLSFDMREVRNWAEFSGDYNPIHFDLEHARLAGLDRLIVHGMLALLPVKLALTNGTCPTRGWMQFRAVLRAPIAHHAGLELQSSRKDAGMAFRLQASDAALEHARGSLTAVADPGSALRAGSADYFDPTPLGPAHRQRLAAHYPEIQNPWIALDAIVFAEFIGTKIAAIDHIVQEKIDRLAQGGSMRKVVVQVSHTVRFDAGMPDDDVLYSGGAGALHYAMQIADMIESEDQLIGTVSIPVHAGSRLLMLMEIGLIAKFKPAQTAPQRQGAAHA